MACGCSAPRVRGRASLGKSECSDGPWLQCTEDKEAIRVEKESIRVEKEKEAIRVEKEAIRVEKEATTVEKEAIKVDKERIEEEEINRLLRLGLAFFA